MVSHAKGGDNGRNNYINNEVKKDILIFGSSRALHHYNPTILSDSLGLSCYNCGQDGNGIILNYGRFQLIKERYVPTLIIYDVMPLYDYMTGEDNHKYLGWLKAYYDKKGIPDLFDTVDPCEKYKMQCQMYRYNTKFIQIISDFVHPFQSKGICGYRPIFSNMDTLKISKKNKNEKHLNNYNDVPIDSFKVQYLKKFISEMKNTKLVFINSPLWYGMDSTELKPIIEICEQSNIPFYDFANDMKYVHKNEYYKDPAHLNSKGADLFTKDLIKVLKSI